MGTWAARMEPLCPTHSCAVLGFLPSPFPALFVTWDCDAYRWDVKVTPTCCLLVANGFDPSGLRGGPFVSPGEAPTVAGKSRWSLQLNLQAGEEVTPKLPDRHSPSSYDDPGGSLPLAKGRDLHWPDLPPQSRAMGLSELSQPRTSQALCIISHLILTTILGPLYLGGCR